MRPQVARLRRRLRLIFEPFWVVPACWSVSAVALGLALPQLDEAIGSPPLLFEGSADSARSVLSTTSGAMISVTGLVFSITIVVLQLASSQFSPRVIATFLEDRVTQHTLGVFVASFLFSLTVLRSIPDTSSTDQEGVPEFAVTMAFLLVLGAVAMFLAFIQHITQSIAVSTVIRRVGAQTRDLLERSSTRRDTLPSTPPELAPLAGQTVATSRRSGYIDAIDAAVLCRTAAQHEARIEVLYPLGSFVAEGAALALVHGSGADPAWDERVAAAVNVRAERSMEQDMTFGFRRLVDIAERALSPGINDPTTAVQAIDELHDILRRMVGQASVVGVHLDDDQVPRVLTQEWTFAQYLDLAVDEIAHWGKDSLQIPRRLQEMLTDLSVAAHEEHRSVINAKANGIDALATS